MYYLDLANEYTNKSSRIKQRVMLPKDRRDKYMAKRLVKQKGKCFWCGVDIDMSGHLDHIKPIYHGGKSYKSNLVASCVLCNMTKSTDQLIILNEDTIKFYKLLVYRKEKLGFAGGKYLGFHAYSFKELT